MSQKVIDQLIINSPARYNAIPKGTIFRNERAKICG